MIVAYNPYATASELIADRFVRRFNRLLDGQNVRDHAYRQLGRCSTIRRISKSKAVIQIMNFHENRKKTMSHLDMINAWR